MILEIKAQYGYIGQTIELTEYTPVPKVGDLVIVQGGKYILDMYPNRDPKKKDYDKFESKVSEVKYDYFNNTVEVYCEQI